MAAAKYVRKDMENFPAQVKKFISDSEVQLRLDCRKKQCGRSNCTKKKKCFKRRKAIHDNMESFYILVKCVNAKKDKKAQSKKQEKNPKGSEPRAVGAAGDSTRPPPANKK